MPIIGTRNGKIREEVAMPMSQNLKTIEKVLTVLLQFTRENPEWGVTELSRHLSWSKSVVHRILSTLLCWEFLRKNPENDKYKLGYQLIELGTIAQESIKLVDIAEEEMLFLAKETGETVLLEIPKGCHSICLDKIESAESIKYTCGIGSRVPIYAGALGKALLAFLPQEEIGEIIDAGLKQFTERTTTNREALLKELEEIRRNGVAITYGEWNQGALGIAAPIFNYRGELTASIGILGPEFRMGDQEKEYSQLCIVAANRISSKL